MKKSVITLASYDAHMLPNSIKSYYNFVDEIVIGVDKDRISWSKNSFTFNEDKLWSELKTIDYDNKIEIIEDNFHRSETPIENDNFERNFLKAHCSNEWVFSFDADEELINATEFFINYLPNVEKYYDKVDLSFSWILPYKEISVVINKETGETEQQYLVIVNNDDSLFKGDTQGFATNKYNTYTYCRWTDNKKILLSPLAILHWSFCRTPAEIDLKINNYGHSDKTAGDPFYDNWKMVDETNFKQLRNFKTHDMGGGQWEKLAKVRKDELMRVCQQQAKTMI